MFTFVIVAFVSLLALTAFVPKVRFWVQWSFKKLALLLNILILSALATAMLVLYAAALLVVWTVQNIGRFFVFAGSKGIEILLASGCNLVDALSRFNEKMHKRFR